MKHEDVWRAIDTLAAENGLSASGLAKRSGLDATTFNPSKRRMPDRRARWPSTESVAKVLDATGASLESFTALVSGARALASTAPPRGVTRRIPLIGLAQAGSDGYFDDGGYPVGGGWDEVSLPDIADPNAYALEISGLARRPDPPRRPRRGAHPGRGGHGQAAGPPLRPPGRAQEPEP
jgi:phage repressor protein C with HTH and peptisase S24 domain